MVNLIIGFIAGYIVCAILTVVKGLRAVKAGKITLNK